MTNLTTTHIVVAVAGGTMIVMSFINTAFFLYFFITNEKTITSSLQNSKIITTYNVFSKMGLRGKLMMAGLVAGILTFPDHYVEKGLASQADLDSLPEGLKKRLIWCFRVAMFGLTLAAIAAIGTAMIRLGLN